MNILFWALIILMLLLAIVLLVYPLLKVKQHNALAYKDSNLKINEDKLKELDTDLAEGRIDQTSYQVARTELDRELLIDIPAESQETAAEHYTSAVKRHPAIALMITVFVPMVAFFVYLQLGMHAASDENFATNQQPSAQQVQAQQLKSVEEMAQELDARIAESGGTPEEWAMLARAQKYLGNNDLAIKAFKVALESEQNNAQLMLETAEVIALKNERKFTPEARELTMKAYALEPNNANVLWFVGVAEFQEGNYKKAIAHLKDLLPMAGGEEEVMRSIVTVVAKSRKALIDAGEEMPTLEKLLGVPAMNQTNITQNLAVNNESKSAESNTQLTVAVDISDEARNKFNDSDVVFIYAKAKQGPRMPLAAQRITLSALPITVVLDDSMSMAEGMNLSAFEQLILSARVTKSGAAIAQSGDYIGRVEATNTTQGTIKVIIDTVVP